MTMQNVDVTPRVWERVLAIRAGLSCPCCGEWSAGERGALALYGPVARRDLGPVMVGQIGQSLDGRIATVAGDARDISGPDGLKHLHRLRALVDGVVIGVRTALHDTPRLTVRLCPGTNPARVIIDPNGRLPDEAPVLRADGAPRFVIQSVRRTRPAGVEVIRLTERDGRLDPRDIHDAMQKNGLANLLVEGGAITLANFLDSGLLTRLQVAVTPLLIGGGPLGFHTRAPVARLSDALRPEARIFALGSDILFDCALLPEATLASLPIHQTPRSRISAAPG
jgi:riboflavin-specific deaminase-like protein